MSEHNITLKRHNHRVHPCPNDKKEPLLKLLLEQNNNKNIIVVSTAKPEFTSSQANVSFMSDEELNQSSNLRCELLISLDLPSKALQYIKRLSHTISHALAIVNPAEERLLHPIEVLLGRTIMQEPIDGFSEVRRNKQAQPTKKEPSEPRKSKFSDDESTEGKKSFKAQKSFGSKKEKPWSGKTKQAYEEGEVQEKKSWDKKPKKENKFLGKDENGKAKFSGKSGERNHYFDGTPKPKDVKLTGKKINIKDMKNKKGEE